MIFNSLWRLSNWEIYDQGCPNKMTIINPTTRSFFWSPPKKGGINLQLEISLSLLLIIPRKLLLNIIFMPCVRSDFQRCSIKAVFFVEIRMSSLSRFGWHFSLISKLVTKTRKCHNKAASVKNVTDLLCREWNWQMFCPIRISFGSEEARLGSFDLSLERHAECLKRNFIAFIKELLIEDR